ncbi:TetR/AcrR family transcriptional regulator [Cypionkella sp.]|uniref:TetR/AcrR family transcriptional regulator n=1 Tax=Cypionkella sp. TaxID=2811411 RepID=UPI002ABAE25C|nr:TetR/AcrR family transcriptional regulator [Cypionkella sp.]MDZ4394781.1 TetR/AcrR family transcriptional regulator [Cypionkella sp.]
MTTAYHRKKDPEAVREKLLSAAESLALSQGLQAVTMQAVADAAGVTKGGFLHHFPSKEALFQTLFAAYVRRLEAVLDRLMQQDPTPYGRFSRAYLRAALEPAIVEAASLSGGIVSAFNGDPDLRRMWYDWLTAQEQRHIETDGAAILQIVRRAADGLWFASQDGAVLGPGDALLPDLLALTAPPKTQERTRGTP